MLIILNILCKFLIYHYFTFLYILNENKVADLIILKVAF